MSLLRQTDALLYDSEGNGITSTLGALDVTLADTNFNLINELFYQTTAVSTTIAVDTTANATSLTVASATGFTVGDVLDIYNGDRETVFPSITNIVGNVFTLDKPLDNIYTVGDSVDMIITNMAEVGTLASPKSFKVMPLAGQTIDLTRILIEMTHSSAGDNGLFGDLSGLTNGCVLRVYSGLTDTFTSLTIWKTNSDIAVDMYDISYPTRSGGGGLYGTNARGTFKNAGAVIRLIGDNSDYLELLVQDDLSGLDSFRIKAQGHLTN